MFSSLHARFFVFIVLTGSLTLWPSGLSAASKLAETRARAMIEALSSGDPAKYERAAQENFGKAALARRTAQDRADFAATVHSDFGLLTIDTIDAAANELKIVASGKGGKLQFVFGFEPPPAQLIQSLSVEPVGEEADNGPAVPLPPVNASMTASQLAAGLEQWLKPYVQNDDFAGVVLIAKDGMPIVVQAYGPADREAKRAANTDTAYNVASIGKKFTHTAIAKLIQDGKLKASNKLGDIIPDYPNPAARNATVDQLLNMKGGISDFFGPGFAGIDKTTLNSNHAYFLRVSKLPQRFDPGTKTEYCNGCYVVLGEMIERISGKRFEDYVADVVFQPADMKRTGYFNSKNLPANTAIAYGRVRGPKAPYESTRSFHGATGSGAGGVYTTAKDLLIFDNALRDGKLLNPDMTAWTLRGAPSKGRNMSPMGIAGGSHGTSAILESDGKWVVVVTANVDEPLPERLGIALSRALHQ